MEKADKRTTLGITTYLDRSDGLTVWSEGCTFDPIIEVAKTKLEPFSTVFGETDSIHEAIRIRNKTNIPNKTGYIHNVDFWKNLFLEGFGKRTHFNLKKEDRTKAKQLAIRLALTAPSIFEQGIWKAGYMLAREDTAAWAAANRLLGTWRWDPNAMLETDTNSNGKQDNKDNHDDNKVSESDDNPNENEERNENHGNKAATTETTDHNENTATSQQDNNGNAHEQTKTNKTVEFSTDTIDPKHRNPLFLQCLTIKQKQRISPISKDYNKKHKTYLKWRSPRLKKESVEDMENETIFHFKKFFTRLKTLDESLILIPWYETSGKSPLKKRMK